ncbi:hypothetical protein [Stieleria mannarensis]|uniref:hypothetical protein n=1 Tax=Stieleria mannarensis TaxID=2755585 RepID=UPI0015FFF1A9|nr:hypothetical protein [Rhodopirellula sp. JC639]
MFRRWITGVLIGTALVGVTSPLFVRSYVPRTNDPVRGVAVLQPGAHYRWRSEGYATTRIGPMGMPGKTSFPAEDRSAIRLTLWGDSQAEGVCVDDHDKIAAQLSRLSSDQIQIYPFARSGDDCNDWIPQIAALAENTETRGRIDAHVFLIVEWSDWCIEIDESPESISTTFSTISATLPAFVIQTVRNIITRGDGTTRRRLRFRPGPVDAVRAGNVSGPVDQSNVRIESQSKLLALQLQRLRQGCDQPCIFVYAPMIPAITDGQVRWNDPDQRLFERFQRHCADHGFHVIDGRPAMKSAAIEGEWPRGFHNGQFGVGHYNASGNRIIAERLLDVRDRITPSDGSLSLDEAKD